MTTKKRNWTIRTRMILLLIPAIIAVLLIATLFSLQLASVAQKDVAYDDTLNSARAYAHEFNTGMSDNLAKSRTFSIVLDQNTGMTREGVLEIQHTLLRDTPEAIGIGVVFEPGAFDGPDARYVDAPGHTATGRFASYWNRLNGTESLIPVVDIETSDWYTVPKRTQKEIVMEPLLYEGVLMTSYIAPIIKNGTFAGTVGIDVPLQSIDQTVSQVKVFDTGYAFLVSNTGMFVSSPKKEYIGRMSLDEISREKNIPGLAAMAADIRTGNEGYAGMADPFTGKDVVMFYTPIQTGNWSMVVVAPTDEMLAGVAQLGMVMLLIGLLSIVVVGGIILIVARNLSGPIMAMSTTADRIASGDLDVHVPDQGGELGVLANAFNNMAARLRELIGRLEAKVAELQDTQAALKESEEKYRDLVDNSHDIIYTLTVGGVFTFVSPAWTALLGHPVTQVMGQPFQKFVHPDDLPGCMVFLKLVIEMGQRQEGVEYRVQHTDGTWYWHTSSAVPFKDEAGTMVGFYGIARDITERKVAEETLFKVNQKLNVLSQLTRKDLTNQTFVLSSYLELVKNQLTGQDHIIETVQKGVDAVRLIHETIEYSKDYQDMGAKPPKWQNVKMALLFGLSHISIGKIQHSIETENLEIYSDPLLEKVCQRLFENSVKHGDHVTRIRVWHTVTPEGATIFFEDDGVGIPQEKKEQIFLRAQGTSASRGSLIFVREILDITGICIKETGELGKGARFEMTVPKGTYRMKADKNDVQRSLT